MRTLPLPRFINNRKSKHQIKPDEKTVKDQNTDDVEGSKDEKANKKSYSERVPLSQKTSRKWLNGLSIGSSTAGKSTEVDDNFLEDILNQIPPSSPEAAISKDINNLRQFLYNNSPKFISADNNTESALLSISDKWKENYCYGLRQLTEILMNENIRLVTALNQVSRH